MKNTYRVIAKVTSSDEKEFGSAKGAYVNIYFPDQYFVNWEIRLKSFIEYYNYNLIEWDCNPVLIDTPGNYDFVELSAIEDSKESGHPRFGKFHTYLEGES